MKEVSVETSTHTLVDEVDRLVQSCERPLVWGNPPVSTTPTSMAIRDLAARTEALENAVRQIALDVQKLLADE